MEIDVRSVKEKKSLEAHRFWRLSITSPALMFFSSTAHEEVELHVPS
jgi:hypothetical protein